METVVSPLLDRRAERNLPIIVVLDCCLPIYHGEDLHGVLVSSAVNVAILTSITVEPEEGLMGVNCSPYTHFLLQYLERGLTHSELNGAIAKELTNFGRRQVCIFETVVIQPY